MRRCVGWQPPLRAAPRLSKALPESCAPLNHPCTHTRNAKQQKSFDTRFDKLIQDAAKRKGLTAEWVLPVLPDARLVRATAARTRLSWPPLRSLCAPPARCAPNVRRQPSRSLLPVAAAAAAPGAHYCPSPPRTA